MSNGTDGAKAPTAGAPDLRSLIERLEAATEGGRELDEAVWLAAVPGATMKVWSYIHTATGRECEVRETRNASQRLIIVPSYTTSIDAALTLVPKGWGEGTLEWWPRDASACVCVAGADIQSVRAGTMVNGNGGTMALALCIAALKARQTANQGGPTGSPDRGVAPGISDTKEKDNG